MYHLTSEQIQVFLTLAKTKNFREASELLFITQPAVTKYIQRLEKELGVSLFRRTTQKVELTEAGSFLAESWLPLYHRFLSSIDELHFLMAKQKNELTISVLRDYRSAMAAEYLAESFREYLKANQMPEIALSVRFLNMKEQREALQKHLVDFNISLGFDYDNLHSIKTLELSKRRIYALLPPEHPLAGRASISIQELTDETFLVISASESTGINQVTVSMLKKLLPHARMETVPNLQSMAFALQSRRGITLGNRFFVHDSAFVEVPITELQNAVYEETLTWRTDDMSTNKLVFLAFVRENLKKFAENQHPDFYESTSDLL